MELKGRTSSTFLQKYLTSQANEVSIFSFYRINFNGYKREPKVPHNSEVLKLLREQEASNERPRAEGLSPLQENRNYHSNECFLSNLLFYSPSVPQCPPSPDTGQTSAPCWQQELSISPSSFLFSVTLISLTSVFNSNLAICDSQIAWHQCSSR